MAIWTGHDLNDEAIKPWDGQSSLPNIPPGTYEFEAISCELKQTNAADGSNFLTEWQVVSDGVAHGEKIRTWHYCDGPKLKPAHLGRIKQVFTIGLGLGTSGVDTEQVPGRRLIADIVHKTELKYDLNTQQERQFTNITMCNEKPVAAAPEPAAPVLKAAPPKAPSAPPPRPPVAPRPRQ